MNTKSAALLGLAALAVATVAAIAWPGQGKAQRPDQPPSPLVTAVRTATQPFRDAEAAKTAGYGLFHGCVSGPQEGAMGIHLVNGALVGDGLLDAARPEALLYEVRDGRHELLGVEYVVIAEAWHAHSEAPPVLMGQLFNYVGAPNRYGIPAFYELHVWAWKANPSGAFADWNPTVSCDEFVDGDTSHQGHR